LLPPSWYVAEQHNDEGALAFDRACPVCHGGGALVALSSDSGDVIVSCDDCGSSFAAASDVEVARPIWSIRYIDYPTLASSDEVAAAGWPAERFFEMRQRPE
jgi:hypothetical protein